MLKIIVLMHPSIRPPKNKVKKKNGPFRSSLYLIGKYLKMVKDGMNTLKRVE
jgi:hypothetical protein